MLTYTPTKMNKNVFYNNFDTTKRIQKQNYSSMDILYNTAVNMSILSVANDLFLFNKKNKRRPTQLEITKGVLPHLLVQEVPRKQSKHVDKYYWTPSGKRYRSIAEIKRDTVFLNVYKDGNFYGKVGRLLSDTSAEVVSDLSPCATLFYQGIGRSSKQMLGHFLKSSKDIRLVQGRENITCIQIKF